MKFHKTRMKVIVYRIWKHEKEQKNMSMKCEKNMKYEKNIMKQKKLLNLMMYHI